MHTDTTPVPGSNFEYLKVGDKVTRMLAGVVPMQLVVSHVTDTLVGCVSEDPRAVGAIWTFSRRTGAEIDDDLGWGDDETGSYLVDARKA